MTRTKYLPLVVITLVSFGLRVWGIQFGLPFEYHPDEQQYIPPAINFVSGNFRPWAYYNPMLYPYFIGVVFTLTYWGLKLFGAFPAFFDLNVGWSDPMLPWISGAIYLARFTSVALGVITTLMVYQLGRRAYSHTTGLAAAIIFGFTFLPAREAHFAVSDGPVALGVAVTLYVCLNIVRRGRISDYVWAGAALGLSAAIKYTAGLLVLPLGAAHLLSHRYHNWRQRLLNSWPVILAGVISIVAYAIASPYTLLEAAEFWEDFSENMQSARTGFQGLDLDPAGGALFYAKTLIWGFGWPLFALFIIAIIFMLWRRKRIDLLLLILPLFGFWYMQRQAMYFVRWLTPFLPPLSVLAAETVHVAVRHLRVAIFGMSWLLPSTLTGTGNSPLWGEDQSTSPPLGNGVKLTNLPLVRPHPNPLPAGEGVKSPSQREGLGEGLSLNLMASPPLAGIEGGLLLLVVGIALLMALPSTYMALNANALFAQTDTRTEALHWIQQHIPPGSTIAAEVLSPPWGPPLAMPGLKVNPYNFAPVPEGGVAEVNLQQLRDWQVQYVVTSSYYYARPLLDKSHQARLEANMQTLDKMAELLVEFQPYQEGYDGFFYHDQVYGPANDTLYRRQPGPVIKIYRLP